MRAFEGICKTVCEPWVLLLQNKFWLLWICLDIVLLWMPYQTHQAQRSFRRSMWCWCEAKDEYQTPIPVPDLLPDSGDWFSLWSKRPVERKHERFPLAKSFVDVPVWKYERSSSVVSFNMFRGALVDVPLAVMQEKAFYSSLTCIVPHKKRWILAFRK